MKKSYLLSTIISQAVLATCLLLGSAVASAATVSVMPVTQDVLAGDTVSVDIVGTGFTNVSGGGLDITWDSSVLTMADISGVSLSTTPWQAGFSDPGTLTTPGSISLLKVGLFPFPSGYTGDAAIATLTFTASNTNVPSSTAITIVESTEEGGSWSPVQDPLDFVSGTVNISAVPVPAAVWLFGSGLLGLVSVARRKKAA